MKSRPRPQPRPWPTPAELLGMETAATALSAAMPTPSDERVTPPSERSEGVTPTDLKAKSEGVTPTRPIPTRPIREDRSMKLKADETELVGGWTEDPASSLNDAVTQRINDLVKHELQHIAADASGWDHLYRDPSDGRLWELVYPNSGWHGGGPPLLRVISLDLARDKYGIRAKTSRVPSR